jgi:hypothetical protein
MTTRRGLALLFLLGMAARLPLLIAYPAVHGEDSAARLAYCDRLVLAYQLPLPQLLVVVMRYLAPHPFWTRLAFVVVGALVAPLLARVVTRLESPAAGLFAGALAAVHPLLVYYSLVPYQEGPMIALLLAGAAALLDGRRGLGGLFFGLASLCRYEAWIAAALVALRRPSLRSVALFGWAPIGWMLLCRGLAPQGTYVMDLDANAGHLQRLPFLTIKLLEYSGAPLIALGAVGAAWVLGRGDRRWRWPAAFVVLVVVAVVLVGHEFPAGTGHVSERIAHLPAIVLCAAAAVVLTRLAADSPAGLRLMAVFVAGVAIAWSHAAWLALERANLDPALRLAVQVAEFADQTLGASGRLAVAAPPVHAASVRAFVDKVGVSGGDVERARRTAVEFSRLTPDGVRIAAQLARPAGTVVAPDVPAALVAVFDDSADRPISPGRVAARFAIPPRGVTVYVVALDAPALRAPDVDSARRAD